MTREVWTGFLLTSGYDARFDREVLTKEDVREIFGRYEDQPTAMLLDHQQEAPSSARVLSASLKDTNDGELGIFVEIEADAEEMENRRGLSVTVAKETFLLPETAKPPLELSVDAYHFHERDLTAAAALLAAEFRVGGGRLYRFQEIPPPDVFVALAIETLKTIPANVLANLITSALGRFTTNRRSGEPSRFFFRLRRSGRRASEEVTGFVETGDPEMLRVAGEVLKDLHDASAGLYRFDGKKWKRSKDA
jgi:hypothetical protein